MVHEKNKDGCFRMRRQQGRSSGQAQAPCDWGHKGGPDKKQSPAYALEGEEAGARICRALSILSEMKAVGSFLGSEPPCLVRSLLWLLVENRVKLGRESEMRESVAEGSKRKVQWLTGV